MNEKIAYTNIQEFIDEKTKGNDKTEEEQRKLEDTATYDLMIRTEPFIKPNPGCLSPDACSNLESGILEAYEERHNTLPNLETELVVIQIATMLNTFGKRCFECSRIDECEYAE